MAKKKRPGAKKATANPTADEILAMWTDKCDEGLDPGMHFDPAVGKKHNKLLLKAINKQLTLGNDFGAAKDHTLQVAIDIGKVCSMLTTGDTVSVATFEQVFKLMKNHHPACPIKAGGGGAWCNEGG